jgi:myo-inositol-1(or 4)-monophosphatase
MSNSKYENILKSMREAALIAGELTINSTPEQLVNLGTSDDMVTEVDLEADRAIREKLLTDFPSVPVLTEETCKIDPGYKPSELADFTGFLVDPIDGSVNFSRHISSNYGNFAVSIGYCEDGIPMVGLIYKPLEQEIFHAIRGQGAFMNGQVIRVSEIDTLGKAAIELGSFWIREQSEIFLKWFTNSETDVSQILIRGSAAAALADVARGRIEAMLHSRLNAWDYAAGWILIEEAGGKLMDADASPIRLGSRFIYATNSKLSEIIMRIVKSDL